MFIKKQFYYLYIDNINSINLNSIKLNPKVNIIYRNIKKKESIIKIIKFRKICKSRRIKFFVANNLKLLNRYKEEFDRLMEISPDIEDKVLKKFKMVIYNKEKDEPESCCEVIASCFNKCFCFCFLCVIEYTFT